MRIFCPYCSAEHAVDVNQIPLVGMDFHCPQCTRSFRVTADGEVEATDDGTVDGPIALGGGESFDDPFAAFGDDLDLTSELDTSGVTDEELMAASFAGGSTAPPPLPALFVDMDDQDDGQLTGVMPAMASPPAAAARPAAMAPAPRAPAAPAAPVAASARPIAPPPERTAPPSAPTFDESDPFGSSDGLTEQDLVLIGSYHKTSDALTYGEDVVWTAGEQPGGGAPQQQAATAAPPRPAQPRPAQPRPAQPRPAQPTPVQPTPAPPSAPRPRPQAPAAHPEDLEFGGARPDQSIDLESSFEITTVGAPPSEAVADAGDDWQFPELDVGGDLFGGAPAGPASGAAADPDAFFDLGPVSTGGGGSPTAAPTGLTGNPDALFDLDLEIGSPAAKPRRAGVAMGPTSDIGSFGTSQPLLEEMDFSSLLQEEESAAGEDSIFDLEPSGVFEGAAIPDAAQGAATGGMRGAAAAAEFGDELFDLDLGGDAPPGGMPGMAAAPGSASLEESFAGDASFKPAKVPTQKKRRGMSKGLQYGALGAIFVLALGLGLGQIPDVGYFGVNLLFPPEKVVPPSIPKPRASFDPGGLTADTVAAYLDQIQRLEKELELHPDADDVKRALAESLAKFSTRYPGEFEYNKKFQRRLEELTKELGLGEASTLAVRQKLLAGDPKEAKEALDRLLMEKAGGAEVALLRGQIEMKEGDYAEAVPHFETALQIDPESLEARYLLGRCLRLSGRLPEALAAFQAVLKKSPQHDSARVDMAELRLEMSEPQEALELAQGLLEDGMARKLTEQTFAAHRLLARIYAQLGDAEKEKEHLEEALSIKPYDEALVLQMASYLKARGALEEATARLSGCWDQGCNARDYYFALAELYVETGNSERSLEVIQTGLEKYKDDMSLVLLRGRVLQKRGEVVAAREAYRRAIDIDPTIPEAYEALADLVLGMERPDEAAQILNEGIPKVARPETLLERLAAVYETRGKRTEAQQILGQLVDRDPLNFPARLRLATLLKRAGLVAEALTHFEFLYRNNQMQREVRLEYADALREARRYEQAERELRHVLRIDANDLFAKVLLGAVLVEQSHFDEAEGYLKEVVEKEPRHGMAFYYLGKLEIARGNPKKALDYLAQAVRSPDPRPEYNFEYAETLMQVGGRKGLAKADSAYTGIITADEMKAGGSGFERMVDVYLHRGQVRLDLHQFDKALEDFEKAMALNPLRADTVTAFASGLIKKKRYAEAERYLETVIKENPNFSPAYFQLGVVFSARNKLADAKRNFLKSLMEDDAAFPEAHRYLGYIFREQRLDREARRYFTRYLELVADDAPDRPDIERLLGIRK